MQWHDTEILYNLRHMLWKLLSLEDAIMPYMYEIYIEILTTRV
jgi:hypothetical protein